MLPKSPDGAQPRRYWRLVPQRTSVHLSILSTEIPLLIALSQGRMDIEELLSSSEGFTSIIYTLPLQAETVQVLEMYSRKHQVPLLAAHCVGFYSYFTTKLPCTLPVVDTHPDEAAMADLRLLNPWGDLAAFAEELTRNIDTMDDHAHGHLPMVVLLIHYLEQWKLAHNGEVPLTYKEKTSFRDLVANNMRRTNPEGGEENFEEAISAVMKHIALPTLSTTLKLIFDSPPKYEVSYMQFAIFLLAICCRY